jgi:uncharacterized membrane protein YesL
MHVGFLGFIAWINYMIWQAARAVFEKFKIENEQVYCWDKFKDFYKKRFAEQELMATPKRKEATDIGWT